MKEKIIFKRDRERIENLLEDVFEKVSKQKLNVTVYCLNSTKIWRHCRRCPNKPL